MCGLVAVFDPSQKMNLRREQLELMCNQIAHRGPDDDDYFIEDGVGLGFRRLSIIDLENGRQPMSSALGRARIVFNGEIYNFRELRKSLAHRYPFKTDSDTEVILALYETEGLQGLERLNGMFAIVIWDSATGEMHVVRDRLGVKPIYYHWHASTLIVASEPKAILAACPKANRLNQHGLWDYLTFRYVPEPHTMWTNIFKLPPAHRLSISLSRPEPKIERWWRPPNDNDLDDLDEADLIEHFQNLFDDAVQRRLVADVPVGILLSGGLDSSAVAAVTARNHSNVDTFSVKFANSPDTDETPFARQVSEHLGTNHREIEINVDDFVEFLPSFVRFTDDPIGDLASIPLYYVSKLAREHVKVVLSGEGSDEILAGYNFDVLLERWEGPPKADATRCHRPKSHQARGRPSLPDLRSMSHPPTMTNYYASDEKREMMLMPGDWPDSLTSVHKSLSDFGPAHPLDQALHTYCQNWLVEDLLMKADRMSMANSLELRTPFLDYRLVEFAYKLPVHLKIGLGANGQYETKYILRRMSDDLLPKEIIDRPKRGFPVPVYEWLSNELKDWANSVLDPSHCALSNVISTDHLKLVISRGCDPNAETLEKHRLWNLLILELWFKSWQPSIH